MNTTVAQVTADPGLQGRVAVKLFLGIADEGALIEEQRCTLAGLSSRTMLHNWRKKVAAKDAINLSGDTLERLSYLAGIYKGIQLLFSSCSEAMLWAIAPPIKPDAPVINMRMPCFAPYWYIIMGV